MSAVRATRRPDEPRIDGGGAPGAPSRVQQASSSRMTIGVGTVYLVGAGPGDPGLLTRRGEAVLSRADVVVYDHLASGRLLDLAPREALRLCAGWSVGGPAQGRRSAGLWARGRGGRVPARRGDLL